MTQQLRILFFCLVLTLGSCVHAQVSIDWAKRIGGGWQTWGTTIALDSAENVYTSGNFSSPFTDFDPGPGTYTLASSGTDIFVCKLDSGGNFLWVKQMGGSGNDGVSSMVNDKFGNIYIIGSFQGTVDFDPGIGTFTLSSFGLDDIFVAKLDASGNFLWASQMGSNDIDIGYAIQIDSFGNIYTAGNFQGICDFDPGIGILTHTSIGSSDIFVSKLDPLGNLMWAKQFGGSGYDICYSASLDVLGNIYMTGFFFNSVDFDPGPGTYFLNSSGGPDVFVNKLSTSGSFLWAKKIGEASTDVGNSIVTKGSNVYVTGKFYNTIDMDPGPAIYSLTSVGMQDVFVVNFDTAGNFIWARGMGGTDSDIPSSIALDANNNIYITGAFQSNMCDFDPSASIFSLSTFGCNDIFICRLNANGNFSWATSMGGTSCDYGNQILIKKNNIYSIGSFQSVMVDFDPSPGIYNLSATGSYDIFVSKLFSCIEAEPSPTNITSNNNLNMCNGSSTTLTAISSGTVIWYTTPNSTIAIGSGTSYTTPSLTSGTYTFYAEANSCTVNPNRTPITVTVNPLPNILISPTNTICIGESTTLTVSGANTYTWNTGSNGISIVATPTSMNNYYVTGVDINGCYNTAAINVVACSGLNEVENQNAGIKIFPNPNTGYLTIELNEPSQIVIQNILGVEIFNRKSESLNTEISLQNFPNGIYFLNVFRSTNTYSAKIIKN